MHAEAVVNVVILDSYLSLTHRTHRRRPTGKNDALAKFRYRVSTCPFGTRSGNCAQVYVSDEEKAKPSSFRRSPAHHFADDAPALIILPAESPGIVMHRRC